AENPSRSHGAQYLDQRTGRYRAGSRLCFCVLVQSEQTQLRSAPTSPRAPESAAQKRLDLRRRRSRLGFRNYLRGTDRKSSRFAGDWKAVVRPINRTRSHLALLKSSSVTGAQPSWLWGKRASCPLSRGKRQARCLSAPQTGSLCPGLLTCFSTEPDGF